MNGRGSVITIGVIAILFLLSGWGCSDDPLTSGDGSRIPAGGNLLGLADGRTFDYLRVDTSVTWFPTYALTVDTGQQFIRVSGGPDDWVIKDDTSALINLKVSGPFVMHNGYWRLVSGLEALVTYPNPAVVMDTRVTPDDSWESTLPVYTSDSGSRRFAFVYGYFGFHSRKTYRGTAQVFVPGFAGEAHRFDVELFINPGDSLPVASAVEYYASGTGLVKWEFHGEGFTRVLVLRGVL